jgi:Holliday junction DNA helicase RuvA
VYDHLRGAVTSRADGAVVLEVGGVGFRLAVSSSTLRQVPPSGEATLYAHLLIREERIDLFGFATEAERHLFRQLLLVTGVGPAIAMALLSAYEPESLASHIARGDVALLTRVKGVGRRTAERILVELRDRIEAAASPAPAPLPKVREDAVRALCSLGLPRAEAERRVAAVPEGELPLEELVKRALRRA